MAIICISRTLGAGGEEIGRRVAEETGLSYVDNEIVSEAAHRLRLPEDIGADTESATRPRRRGDRGSRCSHGARRR